MASPDYIPDTEEIRYNYQYAPSWLTDIGEFDRWLNKLKADIWNEGFDAGERDVWEHTHGEAGEDWDKDCIPNPYKEKQ